MTAKRASPPTNRVLSNAHALLDLLREEGPLPLVDLAARLEMPRASVYRLTEGLSAIGLTQAGEDSRVELGLRWLHLADGARRAATDEWPGVRAVLERIAHETGFTTYLSLLRDRKAFCLEWCLGTGTGVLELHPGAELALNLGGAGRALLAFGPEGTEHYLDRIEPRAATRHSIVSRDALLADARDTRRRGYALSVDDVTVGAGAIGVPVRDRRGAATAVISVAGLSVDVVSRGAELAAAVHEAVGRLTAVDLP